MSLIIRAHFDGKTIVPDALVDLPPDQPMEVEVRLLPSAGDAAKPSKAEGFDITSMPFFGMWAAREDMADSVKWVREERDKWNSRLSGAD
ncbi:MAG: hypothetical protein Q7T82_00910 [Armatimonadota bacterium]|nr:hypothetical protein [Armatimonadota bacterium]